MGVIYVVEQHDQVLSLWRVQQASSLRILHLDFHCDMRGLLIDRRSQLAYQIWDMNPGVGQGNFLAHAILEGRISNVRWVHPEDGGRQHDVGTVKYESDLTALPFRCGVELRGRRGVPIRYEVMQYQDWDGMAEGECLDIDWDFFACKEYPVGTIQDRIDAFLGREFTILPEQSYICYSPDFCHPSRAQFERFVNDMAHIFGPEVVELPDAREKQAPRPFYRKRLPPALFRLARRMYYGLNLGLKQRGIY